MEHQNKLLLCVMNNGYIMHKDIFDLPYTAVSFSKNWSDGVKFLVLIEKITKRQNHRVF